MDKDMDLEGKLNKKILFLHIAFMCIIYSENFKSLLYLLLEKIKSLPKTFSLSARSHRFFCPFFSFKLC
jgi:hypothetical protein